MPENPQSVLIVDEDDVVLKTLMLQLQDRGWDVIGANNGTEALELFSAHPTSVALIAMGMPDVDGLELADTLRRQVPDLIIILMTGYPTLHQAVQGLHYPAYDYVVKPFRIEQLSLSIERARRELAFIKENRDLKKSLGDLRAEVERLSQPAELDEESEVTPPEEIPLRSASYGSYQGKVPGGGPEAIASYERQLGPTVPGSPKEEESPPEEQEDTEGEQIDPDEQ